MYTCSLHQWQSSDYPCPPCQQTVTTTLTEFHTGGYCPHCLKAKCHCKCLENQMAIPKVGKTINSNDWLINEGYSVSFPITRSTLADILTRYSALQCEAEIKELREALEKWKQVHDDFDTGYKNIDGKETRMGIAALSEHCNIADRNLRKVIASQALNKKNHDR